MRIGIDGLALGAERDGSWVYLREFVRELGSAGAAHRYTCFVQSAVQAELAGERPNSRVAWRTVNRAALCPRALAQQWFYALPGRLADVDLLHTVAFLPPLRAGKPRVVTVHDVNYWEHPETMKWSGRLWWRLFAGAGLRGADRIIASSQATQKALEARLGIPACRIQVIYPCVRQGFQRDANASAVVRRYALPSPYLLFVGTLEPRKNLDNLLKAFALAKRRYRLPHALVLAGPRGWMKASLLGMARELDIADALCLPGFVSDADLPGLYSGADLFLYVSWYEGFGYPLVEAMACGVPVITSNISSMPEVSGDAAVLVDPGDPEAIAAAIGRVVGDRELQVELARRGRVRAEWLSGERFVRQVEQVYQHVGMSTPTHAGE